MSFPDSRSANEWVSFVHDGTRHAPNSFEFIGIKPLKKSDVWTIASQKGLHTREGLSLAIEQIEQILGNEDGTPFKTASVCGEQVSTTMDYEGYRPPVYYGKNMPRGAILPQVTESQPGLIHRPQLIVRSAQEIMHCTRPLDPYPQGFQCALWVTHDTKDIYFKPQQCCEGQLEHFWKLKNDWENSAQCKQIVAYLNENIREKRVVHSIACFDLGPLEFQDERCFLRHVVAAKFRDVIEGWNDLGSVELVAQCREYCDNCKTILKELLNMDVLENQRALLDVDKHTLVMLGESPQNAISQAVVSMNLDIEGGLNAEGDLNTKGPAAMLRTEIEDNGSAKKDDAEMFSNNAILDPSSPLLWEWKKQCPKPADFYDQGQQPEL
jgi:hypothetical protein